MLNTNNKSASSQKANAVDLSKIEIGMAVVCSNDVQFGVVDRIEGNVIKLNKDAKGVHHYIPASMIARVDDKVHTDRPGAQVMRDWKTESKPS